MTASLKFDRSGLDELIARFEDPVIKAQLESLPSRKEIAAFVGQAIADNFAKEGPGWTPLRPDTIRGSVAKAHYRRLKKMTDEELEAYEKRARQDGTVESFAGPNRQILRRTGLLMKSATVPGAKGNVWRAEGSTLIWGTDLVYAGVHNSGATIYPKSAKALRWKSNTGVHFAKKVTIPKREFMVIREEWKTKLQDFVMEIVGKIVMGRLSKGGT